MLLRKNVGLRQEAELVTSELDLVGQHVQPEPIFNTQEEVSPRKVAYPLSRLHKGQLFSAQLRAKQ